MTINPFFELYVGDRLSSRQFVDIFSPFLVSHAKPLFLPGNVVVKGVQGSGKSMLLSLLKSDVRMEYRRTDTEFPVPAPLRNFIGAGINLAHSNAIDFGYRSISPDERERSLFFADFVNYTILLDLFRSIRVLSTADGTAGATLPVDLSEDRTSALASELAEADVFQGALEGCVRLDQIVSRIRERLNAYRRFLHLNDDELDERIRGSKTGIGDPITVVVRLLKNTGVVDNDVTVFVHVDQYEELGSISPRETQSPDYRSVINRALARRDPEISYRIGTRGHAWRNHGTIFGTDAKLEEERDYKFVDLDEILRRRENRRTWVFPRFAEDVFERRLRHAGLVQGKGTGRELLERLLGKGISPREKAVKYGGSNPRRSVKVDRDWPLTFRTEILAHAELDPLHARLLEAWVLQRADKSDAGERAALLGTPITTTLTAMEAKTWWRKERVEQALIQIAGRCQQRPIWCGLFELIDLSGGNILTFLSICQFIWDTHNQLGRRGATGGGVVEIDIEIQAIGIFKASEYWLTKVMQESGRSGDRFRLARQIGNALARGLYSDRKMSYPGHNGFSVAEDELERYPHVKELLEEMSDYGTLNAWPHTTKERDRRKRRKMYLNPVLCPQFKMHYQRVKEPRYVHPTEVEHWMYKAGLPMPTTYRPRTSSVREQGELPLFDNMGDS